MSKRRSVASDARSSTATATTATAEPADGRGYLGRFAPSPSGDLHLGSLYAAAASYLDARVRNGRWFVRMEDLDTPRVVPGSANRILRTLEAFGFEWDGEVIRQSERVDHYVAALDTLTAAGNTFECSCSRTQLADEERYPGHCRQRIPPLQSATATRLRVEPGRVQFKDRIQGAFRQDVAEAVGDVVLRRRDGIVAYLLAVVVDDAAQNVTHIVRGADLLDNTPRQIYLQRALGLPTPDYAHVPVLVEPDGAKLAKSSRAVPVGGSGVRAELWTAFDLLNLTPPVDLVAASVTEMWAWAMAEWQITRVPRRLTRGLAIKVA